jgi:prepilin-type N-terminal cleavage/methylation domain-containing protein
MRQKRRQFRGASLGSKTVSLESLGDSHMRKQKGFTLIELVVVVMILGILAAVAAPKLLNTSSTATDNGLKQTLGVIRDAIERYAAEHGGTLPAGATFVADLKGVAGDPTKPQYIRGEFPKCPVAGGNANIKISTTPGSTTTGGPESWHYNSGDGTFICNSGAPTKSDPSVNYDEL